MGRTQDKTFAYLFKGDDFFFHYLHIGLAQMIYKNIHQLVTGDIGNTHVVSNLSYTAQTGTEAMGLK